MTQKRSLALVCVSSFLFSTAMMASELHCLNPQGKPVAWWVIIKTPNSFDDYFYRDATSAECENSSECWGALRHDLNDIEKGPLSETLQQIYRSEPSDFMFYNDDTSDEGVSRTHSDFAHAKGVLAARGEAGFWLVHSVPRFPRDEVGSEAYSGLTSNARMNGQSFLCLSLSQTQVDIANSQLEVARPFVYQRSGFAAFADVAANASQSKSKTLQTTDQTLFISVMKSKAWGQDFYEDLVAPQMNAHLLVESWNRGRGTLDNVCKAPHQVVNVSEIEVGEVSWSNHSDHSKWAVTSEDSPSHSVCIGDINRQSGQRARGGGTVCVANESLWRAFYGMIAKAARCQLNP